MCCGDKLNIPEPHVEFFASTFHTTEQWHDQEDSQWDKYVVVSFQKSMWIDSCTHIHCMQEVLGPIIKLLAEENYLMNGVVIEDNLSSHKTDVINDHWCTKLDHFI